MLHPDGADRHGRLIRSDDHRRVGIGDRRHGRVAHARRQRSLHPVGRPGSPMVNQATLSSRSLRPPSAPNRRSRHCRAVPRCRGRRGGSPLGRSRARCATRCASRTGCLRRRRMLADSVPRRYVERSCSSAMTTPHRHPARGTNYVMKFMVHRRASKGPTWPAARYTSKGRPPCVPTPRGHARPARRRSAEHR